MRLRPAIALACAALASLCCSSCIDHSVHAWFPGKEAQFDSALLGTWTYENEGEKTHLTFQRDSDGFYRLDYTSTKRNSQNQDRGSWNAKLLRMNGVTFLDYQPRAGETSADGAWLIPTHGLARLNLQDKRLSLSLLNSSRLESDAKSGRLAELKSTWLPDGDLLLTSNTEELYRYLLKHAAEEDFFEEPTGPFIRGK